MPSTTLLPALGGEPSTMLAGWANVALYSAMAVLTVAMILFAAYLAALGPQARASDTQTQEALVAATAHTGGSTLVADTPDVLPAGPDVGADPELAEISPRARKLGGVALSLSWLGALLLLAAVVIRGVAVLRPPWGNMFEFAVAGASVAALGYCLLARRRRWEWLGLFVIGPVVLTLGLALMALYTEAAELQPALRSVWLLIHVIVAVLAVGIFVIGFSLGVLYLVQARREATRPARRNFLDTLPPATQLERAAYGLNMVGFILWTFTLVAGAIWAQKAWGSYWSWDPKEVWTFVVWVVYAAYMHARATAGWEPRRATVLALVGFGCVVVNFTVVNLLFVGQHSYAGG